MSDSAERITREALNRMEGNVRRELDAFKELSAERTNAARQLSLERLAEINRRLDDLNNSHEKAVQEKKRTDEAAVQVQERTVSRIEFQAWKDEVNRALNLAQGAATARATMMSVAVGIAVLVINLVIRYMTGPR